MFVDALSMRFREWKVPRDPECPVCSDAPTQAGLIDYEAFCGISDSEPAVPEITAREYHTLRQNGTPPFLLDVRKPSEAEIASLGAEMLIPVDELLERVEELTSYRDRPIVVHCRSGARSARAVRILLETGFQQVQNLKGGTLAWSEEIDPSVPLY